MRAFLSASMAPTDLLELKKRNDAWDDLYRGFPIRVQEVEDAVRAIVPHILRVPGASLVFGGHPAITPIIVDIAQRRMENAERIAIQIYQSAFFAGQEFFKQERDASLFEHIAWTPICSPHESGPKPVSEDFPLGAHPLDEGGIGTSEHRDAARQLKELRAKDLKQWAAHRAASLAYMRNAMIRACDFGLFIGGMQGIEDELILFDELNDARPVWLVTRPGGRTARIAHESTRKANWYVRDEIAYETVGMELADALDELHPLESAPGTLKSPRDREAAISSIKNNAATRRQRRKTTMPQDHDLDRLKRMVRQVVGREALEDSSSSLESMRSGDGKRLEGKQIHDVRSALEGVHQDRSLKQDERRALEAIVLPQHRPVVDIVQGKFRSPPAPWVHLGETQNKRRLERVIPAVGCVELPGHPSMAYGGTAFRVASDLLMTNRHVAQIFSTGRGVDQLAFKPDRAAAIDFVREVVPNEAQLLRVSEVVMIHPYWDMALLRVEGLNESHPTLRLTTRAVEDLEGRDIVVIGYPAQDPRNNITLQNQIFRGLYDIKRLQPGKLKARQEIPSFEHLVSAATHDASTLGGNSGSAVIDVATGDVVALHFAGRYLDANFAVPSCELARDARVVDAGVQFDGQLPASDEWSAAWMSADPEAAGHVAPTEHGHSIQAPAPTTGVGTQAIGNASSWTIPLTITVQVGSPQGRQEPAAPATPTSRPPIQKEELDSEGIFGTDDSTQVMRAAYAAFDSTALVSKTFDWKAALASAVLSHLAYEDEASVERTLLTDHGKPGGWNFETVDFLALDNTECFVASTKEQTVVAFRGTAGLWDWLTDLDVRSITTTYGEGEKHTVHRGFYGGFEIVRSWLERQLRRRAHQHPVLLTGHSLGGAIATLAFAAWQDEFDISSVYTFGQPAVGWRNFRSYMREHERGRFFRFVNNKDVVTKVPPGFKHVGNQKRFDGRGRFTAQFEESLEHVAVETMSSKDFGQLQMQLLTQRSASEQHRGDQEGLFISFSDHKIANYTRRIHAQVKNTDASR